MKKLRKQAKELLHAAHKVYHYRRDVISEARLIDLEKAVGEVQRLMKAPDADDEQFAAALKRLDALLHKVGGKIHPKTFISDNLEVLLVAAIIVIGIRTFFFQPFIIPTNSMYPTYSGMKSVIYEDGETPSAPMQLFNKLTKGAKHFKLSAETSGEIAIPLARIGSGGRVPYFEIVKGRKWFGLLPAKYRQYVILVDEQPHYLRVPAEFGLEQTFADSLLS